MSFQSRGCWGYLNIVNEIYFDSEFFLVFMYLLEIRVWQNLAKLGGECTAGRNFGSVSICVGGFSQFHFVFFETENVGKRSFRWLAYRSPSAIFVYHAPIGLHEALPQVFPSSSFVCSTSFKLCCVWPGYIRAFGPRFAKNCFRTIYEENNNYNSLSLTNYQRL